MSRDDISQSAVKKLLKISAHAARNWEDQPRVSAEAAAEGVKAVEKFLHQLGKGCVRILTLQKKKTVTPEVIRMIVHEEFPCATIPKNELMPTREKGKRNHLSKAGVIRVLHEEVMGDLRISKEGKEVAVLAAESFLIQLGLKASQLAKAAKRSTFKGSDLKGAHKLMISG